MAGARKDGQDREAASAAAPFAWPQGVDPADPFGMAEWMKNMSSAGFPNTGLPNAGLHPLMAHPAAAVAAATALGLGLSSQIAGMMFGAMQGAASTLQKGVATPQKAEPSKPAPAPKAPVPVAPAPTVSGPTVSGPRTEVRKPRRVTSRAAAPVAELARDDLKRISGIGPKLEQVLNGRGIFRFADMAALSKAEVERLDSELGLGGRVVRDDWIGQAKALKRAQRN
ncbi:NADH:ubiquinone oxidoreductase [Sinorhizobium medicae]|uniref:Putative NADH dehydrogenase I chain E n=1 Tax=Sinorhizobium medicae TaxID=110321 RepID=A0A508WNV0_9HYPH|nr:NADH ubiquinone oxidoreductase [Sinorhizobium medicae]MBO1939799.1 NADH:ubiquinone oxidoreductase [Sinorhizobium medicae]MDX0424685.1 NADH:ubiquinone oxidoreductase [Sinorhizobium medicae]MDX0431339.1 NADH:ubiquinone oxidoreductase [Sinorhizobium medicae]MDX0444147.1 NADH:ubiquinone oxidoreductase [Sinorhizobium medicae]MDX0461042.1 NADH:ubiquinone oxidoreductase [Sinorhizobium medicae]